MASYNWLKATLFQYTKTIDEYERNKQYKKLDRDLTEEERKERDKLIDKLSAAIEHKQDFINKNLTKKDKNRTKKQAKKDFISAANWSWNTEDVLKLMEEGLIPTNLVGDILNDASWTNNIWCWFNDKVSLKHLIASKNIQILSYKNKCVALNPAKSIENKDRVKKLFEQTNLNLQEDNVNLSIDIHGTGVYVDTFNCRNKSDVVLTLSNIPSGFVPLNSGIKERVRIGKETVSAVITEFDDLRLKVSTQNQNKEKNQEAHENEDMLTKKNKIIIKSISFGNLFGALLANELTRQNIKIDVLNMEQFAWSVFNIFQSIDDISDALKNDDCVKNIKEIWIPNLSSGIHYKSLAQELRRSLQNFTSKSGKQFKKVSDILYLFHEGEMYQGEWSGINRHGRGSLYNKDGDLIYEGEWKDNKRNGEGTRRIINNKLLTIQQGDFKNNVFEKGITIGKNFSSKTMMVQKGKVDSSEVHLESGEMMDFVGIDPETNLPVIRTYNIKNGEVKEKNENEENNIFTPEDKEIYQKLYQEFLKEIKKNENIENNENDIIKNVNNNEICTEKQESEDKKINTQINIINNIEANEDNEQENSNKSVYDGESKLNLSKLNLTNFHLNGNNILI